MPKLNFSVLWFAFVLCLQSGFALSSESLYEATIVVQDRSDEERSRAVQAGLLEVLQKTSGNDAVVSNPKIESALLKAEQYVTAFSYVSVDEGLGLKLRYDSRAAQDLLKDSGVSSLGLNRPALLVWIAVEEFGGERRVLEEGDQHPLALAIASAASERGIPLMFPKVDHIDREVLPIQDLWGLFDDSIADASKRYNAQAILAGRAYAEGQAWSGQWLFLINGDEDRFSDNRKSANVFAAKAVEQASQKLISGYSANSAVSGGAITIQVQGISNVNAYAAASKYFQQLDIVQKAKVIKAAGGTLTYRLDTGSMVQQLREVIEKDGRLELTSPPLDYDSRVPVQLYYIWRG